jgi:hypothetical protein
LSGTNAGAYGSSEEVLSDMIIFGSVEESEIEEAGLAIADASTGWVDHTLMLGTGGEDARVALM